MSLIVANNAYGNTAYLHVLYDQFFNNTHPSWDISRCKIGVEQFLEIAKKYKFEMLSYLRQDWKMPISFIMVNNEYKILMKVYSNNIDPTKSYEELGSEDDEEEIESDENFNNLETLEDFSKSYISDLEVFYDYKNKDHYFKLLKELDSVPRIKLPDYPKEYLNLIMESNGTLYLSPFKMDCPEIDFDLNYNEGFTEVNELIQQKLKEKDGLFLLHGKPGTGKTKYIQWLLCNVNKRVIFVPPMMAGILSSPNFLAFLMDYPDSLLVLEDAEDSIRSRKNNPYGGNTVSNLLNLTDGLTAAALKVQIMCTFNSNIEDIDEALMRKGRLLVEYEFGLLNKELAQKKSDSLGFNSIINKPMSLSEIYNQKEKSYELKNKRPVVGFVKQ